MNVLHKQLIILITKSPHMISNSRVAFANAIQRFIIYHHYNNYIGFNYITMNMLNNNNNIEHFFSNMLHNMHPLAPDDVFKNVNKYLQILNDMNEEELNRIYRDSLA
jgi:hypothetical protein